MAAAIAALILPQAVAQLSPVERHQDSRLESPFVVERGLHDRKVSTVIQTSIGQFVTNSLVEVTPFMHYWREGSYVESKDLVELAPDGSAVALETAMKVRLSPNLNTPAAILIATPQERAYRTSPLGLFYFDAESGRTIELAIIQDCAGTLLPPNQAVWRRIFGLAIDADLRVTVNRAAFESDLILKESPPPPEVYGLNPATTRLEFWHAWETETGPVKRPILRATTANSDLRERMVAPDFIDNLLDFGDLLFMGGRAFPVSAADARALDKAAHVRFTAGSPETIFIAKEWYPRSGGGVLVESARWPDVAAHMGNLPKPRTVQGRIATDRFDLLNQTPTYRTGARGSQMSVATEPYSVDGFVLDYGAIPSSGTSYEFVAGLTYYVPADACFGTLIFRPGCVVKRGGSGCYLMATDRIESYATPASPAVITSKNDDSVGQVIHDSSHNPSSLECNTGLWAYFNPVPLYITNLHMRWQYEGFRMDNFGQGITLGSCSVQFCHTGVSTQGTWPVYASITYCSTDYPVDEEQELNSMILWAGNDICGGDADGNGLPDSWEYQHFARNGINPSLDSDCDTYSDATEYSLGTNPNTWPTITGTPGGQIVRYGSTATFTVQTTPAGAYKQWYCHPGSGFDQMPGEVAATLYLPNCQLSQDGNFYGVSVHNAFRPPTDLFPFASENLAVLDDFGWAMWTNFIANTNGKSAYMWESQQYPPRWRTDSLIYGKVGFTGISHWSDFGGGGSGQVGEGAVTALTRRHGYMRGHGANPVTLVGQRVWFCAANNTVREAVIAAALTRNRSTVTVRTNGVTYSAQDSSGRDYTLLLFSQRLDDDIETVRVTGYSDVYERTLHVYIRPCLGGGINANVPPFTAVNPGVSGNSGNPELLLVPAGQLGSELVMFKGRTTTSPDVSMQSDMDALTTAVVGLDPSHPDHRMSWFSVP